MSRYGKLLQRFKNNPTNVNFEDIKKILQYEGYEAINTGGSHWVFRKDGSNSITIPYKKPIKIIYVKKVLQLLGV